MSTLAPDARPLAASRPFYWSVRRELWENRSIQVAPLVAAVVVLVAFVVAALRLRDIAGLAWIVDPAQQVDLLAKPYGLAATIITLTATIVGAAYCLGALHGERADRSILFWKSLPVSDRTTVLAKAAVPLVVLPLLAFILVLVTWLAMLLVSTAVLMAGGEGAATLWSRLPLVRMTMIQLYGLVVLALWHAPIYAWLLLVSGWARRATALWAALPPIALCVGERIAFGSSHLASLLIDRLKGAELRAYVDGDAAVDALSQLDPVGFIASPGLWIGLIVAAAFLAAAVWMRRHRAPL